MLHPPDSTMGDLAIAEDSVFTPDDLREERFCAIILALCVPRGVVNKLHDVPLRPFAHIWHAPVHQPVAHNIVKSEDEDMTSLIISTRRIMTR